MTSPYRPTDILLVSACRTPVGKRNGGLAGLSASDLGSIAIREALIRAGLSPTATDTGCPVLEVIMGQVLTAGGGQNPARQAAIGAGLPHTVPSYTVNMMCGSGLKAVCLAADSLLLRAGCNKSQCRGVVVAGGQESMSRSPRYLPPSQQQQAQSVELTALQETVLVDGLIDAFHHCHMGVTAENVAAKYGVLRSDQDTFAATSQQKCQRARQEGWFKDEIVPVAVKEVMVAQDEHPRDNVTADQLARLHPAFVKSDNNNSGTGSVTAGNSSGINDGAAAIVLCTGQLQLGRGVVPLGRLVSWNEVGCDPELMGMGPVGAVRGALDKAGWTVAQVDLFEINEAFAAQSVAVGRELGIPPDKLNVCGGAIALGHPIGASGARVLVTLLHQLRRLGGRRGVAALCIGGGMGIAVCVERPAAEH